MNAVETTGLGKRYGRSWALRDCTLAIPAGHVVALVGPNGAGKTTLLHLAVGLAAATAGRISVLGGRARDRPPPSSVWASSPRTRRCTAACRSPTRCA